MKGTRASFGGGGGRSLPSSPSTFVYDRRPSLFESLKMLLTNEKVAAAVGAAARSGLRGSPNRNTKKKKNDTGAFRFHFPDASSLSIILNDHLSTLGAEERGIVVRMLQLTAAAAAPTLHCDNLSGHRHLWSDSMVAGNEEQPAALSEAQVQEQVQGQEQPENGGVEVAAETADDGTTAAPSPPPLEKCPPPSEITKMRERRLGRRRRRRRRRRTKVEEWQPITAKVASFVESEEIEGTGYRLVFRLSGDQIMSHRRGHFDYRRRPKIEVRENKTSEYRESYSGYCGADPKLKNWLYYS